MPERIKVDTIDRLPQGSGRTYSAGGRSVAIFNVAGELYAIDDRCPHRGASLGRGTLHDAVVNCPLHGWAFDLRSGQCVDRSGYGLQRFDVFLQGENIVLDLTSAAEPESDGIYRYLVRYGAMGWVGRFGSVEHVECGYRDRVLVHTSRGIEIGTLLAAPGQAANALDAHKPSGELLRRFTPEDERQARELAAVSEELLQRCRQQLAARSLAIEVIDSERLFDGETLVFYYLGDAADELDDIASELEPIDGARVLFQPVVEPPAPAAKSGGCGSGGCGCHAD